MISSSDEARTRVLAEQINASSTSGEWRAHALPDLNVREQTHLFEFLAKHSIPMHGSLQHSFETLMMLHWDHNRGDQFFALQDGDASRYRWGLEASDRIDNEL